MFFPYIQKYQNIFKVSSAKYYQDSKERLEIKACERYQSLYKKENDNIVVNDTTIY